MERAGGLVAHARMLALVLVAYAAGIAVFHPFANVVYGGDDWAYAWSVKHLVETGELRASSWVTAAAVPQTLWGSLFVAAFGASPRTFNVATLVASLFGLALLYGLCLRSRLAPKSAALLTAFVAVTPHYSAYANSFMSDMYYAVLLIAALFFFAASLERKSLMLAALGGSFAACAFLNRQIGVAIPLAFGAALALGFARRRASFGFTVALLASAVALPVLILALYRIEPDWFGGRTIAQEWNFSRLGRRLGEVTLTLANVHSTLLYVAVLTLPFSFVWLYAARAAALAVFERRRVLTLVLTGASLAVTLLRLVSGDSLRVRGEFLQAGAYGAAPLEFEGTIWRVLCCAASVTAPFLLVALAERVLSLWRNAANELELALFLAFCFAFHVFLTSTFVTYFNNYFLPLLPLAALLVALSLEPGAGFSRVVAPVAFALAVLGAGVVNDAHFRKIEAGERIARELEAGGVDGQLIFCNPSSWAFRYYEAAEADLHEHRKRGPLELFRHVRDRSSFWIASPAVKPGERRWRKERTHEYSTLLGTSVLNVWRRNAATPDEKRDENRRDERRRDERRRDERR
ncbi:MAG TPA: hypothetical protein VFZ53_27445 [Polyangiaceae bacterium]